MSLCAHIALYASLTHLPCALQARDTGTHTGAETAASPMPAIIAGSAIGATSTVVTKDDMQVEVLSFIGLMYHKTPSPRK